MSIRHIIGGQRTVLAEEQAGPAGQAIFYPGLMSCVAITAVVPNGVVGMHVTVSNTDAEWDQMLDILKLAKADKATAIYGVGNISYFKSNTSSSQSTRKSMRKKIQSRLSVKTAVQFAEPPAMATAAGENYGAHLFADLVQGRVRFSWCRASDRPTFSSYSKGTTSAGYPDFGGETVIDEAQFENR